MCTFGIRDIVQASGCETSSDFAAPNGRGCVALLQAFRATAGAAPGENVGQLLKEHQASHEISLAKPIQTGQILGFVWWTRLFMPMFRFDVDDLASKPRAQRVWAELPPLCSDWHVASWFVAHSAQLDSRRPADALGLDLKSVIHVARSLHLHAGLLPALAALQPP